MLKPPGFSQDNGSYVNLLQRMIQVVQKTGLDTRMLEAAQKVFEARLEEEKIVLSSPEKRRLFRQVMKAVLTDMLAKLDDQA